MIEGRELSSGGGREAPYPTLGLGSRMLGQTPTPPPGFGAGPPLHPSPGPGAARALLPPASRPSSSRRPRASRGGEGPGRTPEHPRGQDRRADLQLQHVGGRQLRPGVELCAGWEAHLGVPSRELEWGWLGEAGTEGPPRMRVLVREAGFGDQQTQDAWMKKMSGLFLDVLRTTVCMTPNPIYGSVYPSSLPLSPNSYKQLSYLCFS